MPPVWSMFVEPASSRLSLACSIRSSSGRRRQVQQHQVRRQVQLSWHHSSRPRSGLERHRQAVRQYRPQVPSRTRIRVGSACFRGTCGSAGTPRLSRGGTRPSRWMSPGTNRSVRSLLTRTEKRRKGKAPTTSPFSRDRMTTLPNVSDAYTRVRLAARNSTNFGRPPALESPIRLIGRTFRLARAPGTRDSQ